MRVSDDWMKKVSALLNEAEGSLASDPRNAFELSKKAMVIGKRCREPRLLAASCAVASKSLLAVGEYRRPVPYIKSALHYYESNGDLDATLELRHNLASAKLFGEHEKEILVELHRVLDARLHTKKKEKSTRNRVFYTPRSWQDRIADRIPSNSEIEHQHALQLISLYGTIARAYRSLGENLKAIDYLQKGLTLSEEIQEQPMLALMRTNLGSVYTEIGNFALALEHLEQAMEFYRAARHERGVAGTLNQLGLLFLKNGKRRESIQYFRRATRTFKSLGMSESVARSLVLRARHERLNGSLARAKRWIDEAASDLRRIEKSRMYYSVEFERALIEHARHPKRATLGKLSKLHREARKRKLELRVEIAQEAARIALELSLKPESGEWLFRVHSYEAERMIEERNKAVLASRIERARQKLARERTEQKTRAKKMESEFNAKMREAELLAQQLAKKGSFQASLLEHLQNMRITGRYATETIQGVVEWIETARFRDQSYEELEANLGNIHRDFLRTITDRSPDLTATERRVCVLIRLGIGIPEIANILFVSARTIETHALRIRRKLHIPRSIRLSKFLHAI